MICFYHLDLDGKCAGYLVRKYGTKDKFPERYSSIDYNKYEIDKIVEMINYDENVYIVDFSFEPEEMKQITDKTSNIVHIDHHKSAIQKYIDAEDIVELPAIPGIMNVGWSGSMLAWMWFKHGMSDHYKEKILLKSNMFNAPMFVKLVNDWDMWKFSYTQTRAFHEGISLINHDPESHIWDLLNSADSYTAITNIIRDGDVAIKYRASMMKNILDEYSWECEFEGLKCLCFNQGIISSFDFESVDESKYDCFIGFIYDGENYVYSLRGGSCKNVLPVAVKYGGGGHSAACGFTISDMILPKK